MILGSLRRARIIPLFLVFALGLPSVAFAQEGEGGEVSEISGRILDEAGQPVVGAKVMAYHLSTEQVYSSDPTNAKGEYEIGELPYGYFDVAIETPDGLYVATQVVNVSPASKSVLALTLSPYTAAEADDGRSFPGTDETPVGLARLREKPKGADFWKSGKGIGIIAGGGAVLLLLIASSGGGDDTSPTDP